MNKAKFKALPTSKFIYVNDTKIEVKKLPLAKIIKLFQSIDQLPKEVSMLDRNTPVDELISQAPRLIALSMDKFSKIIVQAVDDPTFTEEFLLNNFGLEETIDLVEAIIEVNNIHGFLAKTKQLREKFKTKDIQTGLKAS